MTHAVFGPMQKMRLVWAVLAATLPVGRLAGAPSAIFDQTTFSGFEQVVTFNSIGNGIAITTEFSEQGVIFGGGLFGMTNGGDPCETGQTLRVGV